MLKSTRDLVRAIAVVVVAVGSIAPAADASFPGRNGRITYGYFSGDPSALYSSPTYSPDGRQLAFDRGSSLAIENADGSDLDVLPAQTTDDDEPAFSPRGDRLVFTGTDVGGNHDLYVVGVDGTSLRRLTYQGGSEPAWSSRGRIAFVRDGDLYTIDPSGRRLRLVALWAESPDWSPHASKLAFIRDGALCVLAEGRARRIVKHAAAPVWSPDGRAFAYETDRGVWTLRRDSGRRDMVAGNDAGDNGGGTTSYGSPAWQPLPRRR
jgi:Tol biopolymer transport system component